MKNLIIVLILSLSSVLIFAQGQNPVNAYLSNPGNAAFEAAVQSLCDGISEGENPSRSKIYLLYVLNIESERLIDELMVTVDSLAASDRFTIGNVLMGMEKLDQAVAVYDAINRDFPNWSCPWRHKGEAYYKMGEYEEAVVSLTQAIATNENHVDAYIWMAYALNELGMYEQALTNLERALSLSPDDGGEHQDEEIPQEQIQALLQELRDRVQ